MREIPVPEIGSWWRPKALTAWYSSAPIQVAGETNEFGVVPIHSPDNSEAIRVEALYRDFELVGPCAESCGRPTQEDDYLCFECRYRVTCKEKA